MDLGLDGRVYLVTGGSSGLGFAAAQALVADGARVVLSAPHEGTASSAVARLTQNAAAAEPAALVTRGLVVEMTDAASTSSAEVVDAKLARTAKARACARGGKGAGEGAARTTPAGPCRR